MQKSANVILLRFSAANSAITAIEYALIASLIAVAIIGGIFSLQGGLNNSMTATATAIAGASGGASGGAAPTPAPAYPNLGPSKPCTNGDSGNCVTNSQGDQLPTPSGYPY